MGGWNFIDKTGMKWGKLTAIKYLGNKKWLCLCDCGNETIVDSDKLPMNRKRRYIKSCECLLNSRKIEKINYFEKIDAEEKAYFLGLLSADGNIIDNKETGNYSIKLTLGSKDKEILEIFKKEVNSNVSIKEFNSTTRLPQGTICTSRFASILLCSKKMIKDIEKYGVIPNKSLVLDLKYDLIPKKLHRHLLRGLIDGDGSFGIYGKKKILSLNLTTSRSMAEKTKRIIEDLIPEIKIGIYDAINCNKNTVRLVSTTQKYTFKLLQLLYENSSIYLERKYNNYLKIKEDFNN